MQCERRAWLQAYRAELRSPESGLARYLREQRSDLRRAYEARLAGALDLPLASLTRAHEGVDVQEGLDAAAAAVLDPTFELVVPLAREDRAAPVRGRVDGMRRLRRGWALEVVAAGTRVRSHHVRQLALAGHAAASRGLAVERSAVVHVRARKASGPAASLLRATDVSAASFDERTRLPLRLRAAGASLGSAREPRTAIGPHCHRPRPCPFLAHCWAGYGDHGLFGVPGLRRTTRSAFRSAGWLDVRDVPARPTGLAPDERAALEDVRNGRVRIDRAELRRGLADLEPPVAYLDFEFATPAVPWIAGTQPFQRLPFQFSLHIEDAEGRLERHEHLHRDPSVDPRPVLAEALARALAGTGSVVVYDAAAETLLLAELAKAAPATAAALHGAAERVWDLLALVRAAVRHPGFRGAWGLKRVATTLVPGSYDGVALPDGLAAQAAWRQLLRSGDDALATLLRRYCGADSQAMAGIVRVLRDWAREGGP